MIKSISYPQYDHLYSVRLFNRINHPTHELAYNIYISNIYISLLEDFFQCIAETKYRHAKYQNAFLVSMDGRKVYYAFLLEY
jgi:hypothetical protein